MVTDGNWLFGLIMSDSWLPANIVMEERLMATKQSKEVRTTIRHTEEENMKYKEEASKLGISKSEYIRMAVNGYAKGTGTNLLESVCRLSTLCNQIMKMDDLDEEQKSYVEGSVKAIWEQLQ